MKKIYLLSFFALFIFNSWSQEFNKMIAEGTYTVQQIQTEAEAYFAVNGSGKGSGYKQYKRWEYQALRDMDTNGYLKSPNFYFKELQRYNSYLNENAYARETNADVGNWQQLGPTSWNATSGWNPGVGRITSIAYDKIDPNHIIVGSETGGVWKTTNGGTTWTVLTDNLSNIDVYALAIDPTNVNNYFWGSTDGTMFKSTDAGATWSTLASNIGTGQINRILIDPLDTSKMYCALETGGLYKSTDSGATWTLIHFEAGGYGYDFEFKPGDPNVVYASGTKVFKSIDGGATFTKLVPPVGLPNWTTQYESGTNNWQSKTNGREAFGITLITPHSGTNLGLFEIGTGEVGDITKIVTPSLNISAASNPKLNFWYAQPDYYGDVDKLRVYYKTSAAGSWVLLASYETAQETWTNIELNLPNPSADYYVAFEGEAVNGGGVTLDDVLINDTVEGVFYSDGFDTGTPNDFGEGAKMLAVTPANPSLVYILEASGTGSAYFKNLYKSTDSGTNFTTLNHSGHNYFGYSLTSTDPADATKGQAPRDMDIAISPSDANEIHIAGVNTYRSLDGGTSFSISTHWSVSDALTNSIGYSHADVDLLEFIGSDLFTCTDGGVFKATNSGGPMSNSYFTDLSTGLGIRQFYKFGVSQTNPVIITGGAQDNGSSTRDASGTWKDWLGGDGMEGFVDKNNSSVLYGTSQNGSLQKSTDGGITRVGITSPAGETGNWITPFEQDPPVGNTSDPLDDNNSQDPLVGNTIYSGYSKVYKSTDAGANWTAISQSFSPYKLDHLKIAPTLYTTMYAAHGSSLYKTTTGSGTWTTVSGVSGSINSIAIHPTNPNKVAVATTSADKVYVTSDGGITWTPYLHDLPNFSALALVWDDNTQDGLYLGMNYGVYYIDNTTPTSWQPFSNNLPNVKISELEVNYADNKLYVATYGRGVWVTNRFDTDALNINDLEKLSEISLYPNPANNTVNLFWNKSDDVSIRIFNALGKLMYYSKDVSLTNGHDIVISNYASGLYFVRMNTQDSIVTKKLIVR